MISVCFDLFESSLCLAFYQIYMSHLQFVYCPQKQAVIKTPCVFISCKQPDSGCPLLVGQDRPLSSDWLSWHSLCGGCTS